MSEFMLDVKKPHDAWIVILSMLRRVTPWDQQDADAVTALDGFFASKSTVQQQGNAIKPVKCYKGQSCNNRTVKNECHAWAGPCVDCIDKPA